jgi:hypothetical protein
MLDVDIYARVITTPRILNASSFMPCYLLSIARHFLSAELTSVSITWFYDHIRQQLSAAGTGRLCLRHLKAGIS